jgi:hypothetical protein
MKHQVKIFMVWVLCPSMFCTGALVANVQIAWDVENFEISLVIRLKEQWHL